MIFKALNVQGAYQIEIERREDARGFFARAWCEREFRDHQLNPRLVQCNISFNTHAGTLRGLHYQAAPFAEAKLVRCTRGALYDVLLDLRPRSLTFLQHFGTTLTADAYTMLYIPEGCAHGFLTLEDNTEIFYQMSEFYAPESARGVRCDDPCFGITLPAPVQVISERDATYPDFVLPDEARA